MESLRICQIAPIAMAVKPGEGDSIEQLVWLLTEELVRRGHEVTLFATGDSVTSARLEHVYTRGYEYDDSLWTWTHHETMHAASAFERASEFDLIHSHAYHFALPFARFVSIPTVHTWHVEVDDDIKDTFAARPEATVVSISSFQAAQLKGLSAVEMIQNGIDTSAFTFSAEPGEYLLYLGRMTPDKGALEAVRAAREAAMPIVLAGPSSEYFAKHIEPLVDGRKVAYVGAVDHGRRNGLLSRAAALIHPTTYPEPFGLVMVEAMACGTPVAATALGGALEIVDPGVTGYCVESTQALADVLPATLALDRRRVRQRAVERFDYKRMVDRHEVLYRRLVAT